MRVPICEWCPKFQLLPLGRAIHNGATFSMFSNEFSRWKCGWGQILAHSHHHASQVTIGLASTAYSREDFFHRTEKLDLSIWKNSVYSLVSRKTGSNRRQMLINARKSGRRPIFAAFLTFLGKFCPKKFVWWEFSPCHLFAITLAFRPFFTVGIPFFYVFKCAAKSQVTT